MDIVLFLLLTLILIIAMGGLVLLRLPILENDKELAPSAHHKPAATTTEPALFVAKSGFFASLKNLIFSASDLEGALPEIEEALIMADVGIDTTEELMRALATQKEAKTPDAAYHFLKRNIQEWLLPKTEFSIRTGDGPFVIYLVGVNGVGKTTTIGKLASQFKTAGHRVMLVAADTFRAAAVEQLRIWSEQSEVDFVGGGESADPSSVIVDGLRAARAKNVDVVLVDTAGRLHTKSNLMEELKKMVRMCEKEYGHVPDEIFIVLDAVTGQNGITQADIFFKAVPLTGIILTKYDSTAKGGIIISVVKKTRLPIRYIGLGEGIADLKRFDATEFVEQIF